MWIAVECSKTAVAAPASYELVAVAMHALPHKVALLLHCVLKFVVALYSCRRTPFVSRIMGRRSICEPCLLSPAHLSREI